VLVIRDLTKVYPGPVAALQGVDLEIGKGMFGLLGPNGAGKTTLMRILAGLLEPTAGSVTLNGEDVVGRPEKIWAQLGYLPQEFGFYPHLTGSAMLVHLLKLKGVEAPGGLKELAAELLDRVNLSFAAKRKVKTYSGGMRQRLGLAQAIAGSPRLIIVDEPTAGLDPEERNRFLNLLSEIGENVVVILSTHIVDDVAEVCTNMAIIRDGRVLRTGQPQAAVDELKGRIWTKVIPKTDLARHQREFRVISVRLNGGRTVIHVHSDTRPDPTFTEVAPDLQDVYFTTLLTSGNGG